MEWKSEPTEIVALMAEQDNAVAMLPQPFVTVAMSKVDGLRVALSLNDEWQKLNNGSQLVTGVVVVRTEFAQKYPQQTAKFLEEYKASVEYTSTNPADAAALIAAQKIVPSAAIAEKALPNCNITFLAGADMKTALSGFLQILFDENAQSVGGTLPADDFYYGV